MKKQVDHQNHVCNSQICFCGCWLGILFVCVGVFWIFAGMAQAQEEGKSIGPVNMPPTHPTSPLDFPAPGRPLGTAAAPADDEAGGVMGEAAEGTPAVQDGEQVDKDGGSVMGFAGGDMVVSGRPGLKIPKFHMVKEKDTLWGLCDYYYGDPWAWPRLWANNKSITNPHWIYPGDKIQMLGGDQVWQHEDKAPEQQILKVTGGRKYEEDPITLRQNGFVDPLELEQSGFIAGSKEERLMLSALDEIYVEGQGNFRPRVGQLYTIYTVREELKSSNGKAVGHIVEILGTARVKRVNEHKVATAEIVESFDPILRKSRVGPLRRVFKQIPIQPAKQDLEATIIATMREGKHIATDELVFIDRGKNQGVQNGNRFLVMRRGDGYRRLTQDVETDNSNFPREPYAELQVLDAREDTSVCLITRAVKEVRSGDYLRMRRGY